MRACKLAIVRVYISACVSVMPNMTSVCRVRVRMYVRARVCACARMCGRACMREGNGGTPLVCRCAKGRAARMSMRTEVAQKEALMTQRLCA